MNTNTQIDKIDKVLSKISGKEMKAFVWQYATTHEDFATALVEKYWKPERGNYKELVEACFAHAGVLGKRFGYPQLDWRKIEQDLAAMVRKAKSMKKKGNLIDAALIAGYVMTITCREFKHDHLAYTPARYDVWAEENKVLQDIVTQSADMVRELLIKSNEIEEDSRLGMLGEIAEQCEEIGDNYFMRLEWFVDEAMPLLCGDDEKADYWAAHGKREKAEKLMWEKRDDENIRDHYIDCLIEWGEYRKAVEVIDDDKDDFHSYSKKWEDKVVKALKLSGDKEWLIEECKKRFVVSGYRIKYYEALKEVIDKNDWPAFFDELWKMPDWEHDYEDAEAQILIKEKRFDLLKDMFVHKDWNLWEIYPKYIKYVPKQDHAFVGEILFKDIKRLALLKEKSKEFNWLLGEIEHVMRKSAAVDKIIKDGIRQLIADYPDKYYFKSYLGSIL